MQSLRVISEHTTSTLLSTREYCNYKYGAPPELPVWHINLVLLVIEIQSMSVKMMLPLLRIGLITSSLFSPWKFNVYKYGSLTDAPSDLTSRPFILLLLSNQKHSRYVITYTFSDFARSQYFRIALASRVNCPYERIAFTSWGLGCGNDFVMGTAGQATPTITFMNLKLIYVRYYVKIWRSPWEYTVILYALGGETASLSDLPGQQICYLLSTI